MSVSSTGHPASRLQTADATDGLRLLGRCLKVLKRHDPALSGWRLSARPDGLLLDLQVKESGEGASGELRLKLATGEGPAARRTPSFRLSVYGEVDGGLKAHQQRLLDTLAALLQARDPGGLELPLPGPPPGAPPTRDTRPDDAQTLRAERARRRAARQARAERARIALADELHFASFVAWKALTTEDLYPHVGPLGQSMSTQELLERWSGTVARIRDGRAPKKLGLYVHIPFCTVACTFCYCGKTDDFDRRRFDAYVDRLCEEIELFAPTIGEVPFTSLYFGGGTPSLLSPVAMRRLFDAIYGRFSVPPGTQVIYEGNPDSLSDRKIEILATRGRVTRLTVGVQTLDDAVQERVRRHNKPEQVRDAVDSARRWGIPHVNLDLMAGLPEQSLDSFKRDLDLLLSLAPDSIHLNAYRPLPRTTLAAQGDRMSPRRVRLRDQMMRHATETLARAGHSDDTGDGMRRTANAANLQEYDLRRQNSSLLGLGFPARAHAFAGCFYAPDRTGGFQSALERRIAGDRRWRAVPADDEEERHKYMVSNLRTGWDRAEFRRLFGMDCTRAAPEALQKLQDLDLLDLDADADGRVRTRTGSHADNATWRVLLYSPAFMERVRAGWGPEYDRSVDYHARMRALVEDFR